MTVENIVIHFSDNKLTANPPHLIINPKVITPIYRILLDYTLEFIYIKKTHKLNASFTIMKVEILAGHWTVKVEDCSIGQSAVV